jgi:cell fate regulator YaaT (PSP1 superfamily)
MALIEVAFKGNRKEFFHWAAEELPPLRAPVIVDADRGEDLGLVHATGELAERRYAGVAHGEKLTPASKEARRLATAEEHARARALREVEDEEARRRAAAAVREHGLVMKLTDAEWQWDRRKLTLYFTAERRVDFRALVRDLASAFRARIELKQIGVRDEAKRLDGIGRCGRQYCSASWLPELRPVNLAVAKDQKLSLNPLQISGSCGRLMCCLRYEHEFYVQSRKRFPKEGRILVTARGEEKVLANDIFNDRVTLRNVEGDVRVIPLADLKLETAAPSLAGAREGETSSDDAGEATTTTRRADDAEAQPTGPRMPRGRRTLPVRDLPPRDSRPPRAARPRLVDDLPTIVPDDPAREEARDDVPVHAGGDAGVAAGAPADQPVQAATILPLGTPEAAAADVQRQRSDRGELPDEGDITATGEDRRRRRRGRRGGRRARGRTTDAGDEAAGGESSADSGE